MTLVCAWIHTNRVYATFLVVWAIFCVHYMYHYSCDYVCKFKLEKLNHKDTTVSRVFVVGGHQDWKRRRMNIDRELLRNVNYTLILDNRVRHEKCKNTKLAVKDQMCTDIHMEALKRSLHIQGWALIFEDDAMASTKVGVGSEMIRWVENVLKELQGSVHVVNLGPWTTKSSNWPIPWERGTLYAQILKFCAMRMR